LKNRLRPQQRQLRGSIPDPPCVTLHGLQKRILRKVPWSKHNHRGIAFYREHGFVAIGEQRFHVGRDIHEDFIMARDVTPTNDLTRPLRIGMPAR
jgi:hypothetical protein